MDIREFQKRVAGRVIHRDDPGYEDLRHRLVWNGRKPDRRPEAIVQVANEADVVQAVRFAREAGLKVSIRGGGHNWYGFSQRDGALLLDLAALTDVSIDAEAMRAEVGPSVKSQPFNRLLAEQGLAFQVGHCGAVSMSGFLLNGGLGWNSNAWRPGCFSIESARVVTADGEVVVAGEEEHSDLLWAVRGAGSGFFGVITGYTLRLHREPRRITSNFYFHPMSSVDKLASWFERAVARLPETVEVSAFMMPAPPELAEAAEPDNGFVCLLGATAFVDTLEQAQVALAVLDESPVLGECLKVERDLHTPIDTMLDIGAPLWPEGVQYLADTAWSNSPTEMLLRTRDHYLRAPSRRSFATVWFSTGTNGVGSPPPDAAYSMAGRVLTLCYAVWDDPAHDEANHTWLRTLVTELDPFTVGHYIGEADIVNYPLRHQNSFRPENWARLQSLRHKYDPDSLFHGPFPTP